MNTLLNQSQAAGYGEPFSRERNNEIYERLVQGDEAARDEMIQGNMALVIVRVEAYMRECPQFAFLRDDLISVGLVGLCEAVEAMHKRGRVKNPNPTGYIYTAIDNHLIELTDEESTIVVPHIAQKRARQEEKPIERPRSVGTKATESCFARLSAADVTAGHDLEDEIRACCHDDVDLKIVEMRKAGCTDAKIAELLGMKNGQGAISRRRKKMFERLKERCPEYADD